jgi:hypothetical protein
MAFESQLEIPPWVLRDNNEATIMKRETPLVIRRFPFQLEHPKDNMKP